MVSRLNITLRNNQTKLAIDKRKSRSLSCEDLSVGGLQEPPVDASLSCDSLLLEDHSIPSGNAVTRTSSLLLGPTPYSPPVCTSRSPIWSPVKFSVPTTKTPTTTTTGAFSNAFSSAFNSPTEPGSRWGDSGRHTRSSSCSRWERGLFSGQEARSFGSPLSPPAAVVSPWRRDTLSNSTTPTAIVAPMNKTRTHTQIKDNNQAQNNKEEDAPSKSSVKSKEKTESNNQPRSKKAVTTKKKVKMKRKKEGKIKEENNGGNNVDNENDNIKDKNVSKEKVRVNVGSNSSQDNSNNESRVSRKVIVGTDIPGPQIPVTGPSTVIITTDIPEPQLSVYLPYLAVPGSPPMAAREFQSVQSGRVRTGVVGGGVMEDGRARAPVTAARAIPSAAQRKVQSLPGYYSRVQQPQPPQTQSSTFRDAFTTNQGVPAQGIPPVTPPRGLPSPRALPKVAQVTAITNKQQLQQQPQLVQWSHQQQQQQLQREYMQQQQALHKQHLQQQQLQNKQMPQQTQQNTKKQPAVPPNATPPTEKKHKKGILGGIFRRRSKKDVQQSDSSSNSDAEDQTQTNKRSFLRRRSKRKSSKETAPPPHPPPPKEENLLPQPGNVRVTMDVDPNTPTSPLGKEINLIVSPDGKRMLRVSPSRTHSLGREGQQHILGIPLLIPPPGQLGRHGVSVSHDSLPVSLNNSSMASHGGSVYSMGNMNMRSSSNETISKKERREQLKARVERLRDRIKGSSSDEEKASISSHSMYGSETSLSNTNSLTKRSRTARTERFLRRKSQELETLRNETEKDKKTREAVQARIEEIQKIQKFEAERNIINAEKILQAEEENKRLYGNNVYEESSVSDSPRAYRTPSCITPSYSPATSPHLKKKVINDTVPIPPKETVILRNKPNHPHQTVTVSLAPPLGTPLRRSFQDHELPFSNDLRGHRSASYDSSINRSSLGSTTPYGSRIVSPVTGVTVTPLNRSGMTPPPPPPRDPSRILSPGGVDSRPTSFSFESLNQETQRPTSGLNNRNFMKGSSPSPSIRSVPTYLGPKPIGQVTELPPPSVPQRRSLSEVQLTPQPHAQLQQQQQQLQQQAPPPRPVPPNISNGNYNYTDQPPKSVTKPSKNQQIPVQQNLDSQQSYYIDTNPQYAKIVPISNIPPSPSSDYSSYMSDNSVKLQKVNNAWRQKDLKNKNVPPHVFSDSSRSNSPSAGTLQGFATSPQNDTYGIIKPKKSKPPPLNLKQAESLSSLSGHSDVPSPVQKTTLDKSIDSDSSNGSLSKDNKNKPQNRPLSMVLEKSESVDKMTPPVTPRRPHPTRRNSPQITSASFETAKKQMQDIIKHNKECTGENLAQFEQMYKNERERLEKARCTNLEDALLELEEIYNSLKLDSDDLLDRAERRDLPTAHQLLRGSEVAHEKHNESNSETWDTDSINGCERRSRTPSQRRSGIPDVEMDDMHYRRCNQNNRNQPDVQKALQNTGSYLLASPALTPPSDIDFDMPKDPMLEDQPDLVFDDVSYRNIQRANSIKIIDPQPPFGIPLGPTTQGSESDYLHVTPKENYRPKMISRIHPDIAMDDYAYRNLRKDNKEVNVAELDELLSESYNSESPVHRKRNNRSVSADRNRSSQNSINTSLTSQPDRGHTKVQTPRKVKQQDARRSGKFFDCYKDAFINVESGPLSPRNNPSWLERAQLVDNKWDSVSTKTNSSSNTNISLSTSTETLTELSSVRAVSQPDIRQAIIREARVAIGGPLECELKHTTPQKGSTTVTPTSSFIPMASTPKVVNMQVIKSAPASPVTTERKPYRPLDSIFNAKPKPFYLAEPKPEEKPSHKIVRPEPKLAQTPVDIAKLDALISSLSNMENNEDQADISSVNSLKSYKKTHIKNASETKHKEKSLNVENINDPHTYETQNSRVNELTIVEPENIEPQTNMIDTTLKSEDEEKGFAKANIQKAIRLSMALESSSSEGKNFHSRRRSAIDLPVKEILSPIPLSPNTYFSDISSLRLNPTSFRHVSALSSPPEQGTTVLKAPSFSTMASTCIDRIDSMLVVSEAVHDRVKRAQSVPASCSQKENDKCVSKVFDVKSGWSVSNNSCIGNKREVSRNINNNKYSTLPSTIMKVQVDNIEVVKSHPLDSVEKQQDPLSHNDSLQSLHSSEPEELISSKKQTNNNLSGKVFEPVLDRENSSTPFSSAQEDISPVNETGPYTVYEVNARSEDVEIFCNQSIPTVTPDGTLSLPSSITSTLTSLSQADDSLKLRHVDSSSSSPDDITLTPQRVNQEQGIRISSCMTNSTVISSEGEGTENQYHSERPPPPSLPPPSSDNVSPRSSSFGSGSETGASGEEASTDEDDDSTEGERPEDQDRYHRRQNSDKVRSGVAPRVRSEASSINNSAICQDKLQEREQRDKKKEYDRLKITQRERQSQQQKQNNNNNNTDETKRRSNDKSSRLHQQQQQHKKRVVDEREKRKSIERDKRRSEEREVKNQRSSEERDKRSRTSPEKLVKRKVVDERDVQKTKIKNSNRHSQSPEKTRRSLTPEKRRSSSSSSNKMVQQLHEQQQQQQQQQTKQQQQLQDSSSTSVQDMDSEKADAERRERIQRYKDERRKQIAARYGGAEWSSSEESGGDDTPSRSYRRRRRAKDAQDTSSTEQSTLETRRGHENGSSLEGRRNRRLRGGSSSEDVVQGVGRSSNRTARLRQSPLSHIAATNLLNDNATADDNRNSPLPTPPTEGGSEVSSELPPLRRPTDIVAALDSPRGMIDSAESPLSGSDTRSGRRRGQGNKDKSNKRMSNLNRATTSEETADLYVLSQPSDSNEDTPRRRRRRAPVSPSGSSGLSAVISPEPLKTPDVVRNVVARLTPPASPTPLQSPQLHPSNSFQPIQPADGPGSQSAPSTLDTRARQAHGSDTRRHSGVIQDANNVDIEETYSRKHPPKLGPLRKPEIPDVLRPKDTTSLASPGVVNTPNNSRPSSVVLDKPPLGPEGLRPAALRSSLRKPPDAGTCFMASRREKVNETKPPTDNFLRELQQRPKKGDRLSKSDLNLKFDELSPTGGSGTSELEPALSSPSLLSPSKHSPFSEENLSNRLDQISARARDTLERVDRLAVEDCPPSVPDSSPPEDSADNMVHECEEYLTVNASNKKDTGSSVVHRETKKGTSTKSTNQSSSLTSKKGVISDTGQKNWHGGSEGSGKESKRLVMEKEVNKELKKDYQILGRDKFNRNTSASPSGPPDNTTHKNNNNNVEPPPDEVIHGLLRRKNTENDTGSQDNSISQSPEHQSKRGSRRCSLDGDSSRNDSPDPMSILKRKSSREDIATERPTTPETHSILKRKTSSRNSSVDTSESDPISILKKKTSAEELDMFEPRPILKKKSSTDDELDDRPRSILKGGRSREDLERLEGIVSPTPILKRSPRCDSDGEGEPERRSILKRRDTTDGVRLRLNVSDSEDVDGDTPSLRVRSDSAPEASSLRSRGRSPPASTAVPSHGILKRRSHTSPARMDQIDNELGAILRSRRSLATDDQESENETSVTRPISPSLKVSTREGERPLSVAERIAGMEASKADISPIVRRSPSPNPCRSPGVRPKVRPTSFERPPTPDHDRVKNDAYLLVAEGAQNNGNVAGVEAVNCHLMDSAPDGVVLLDHSTSASSTDPQDQETPDTPSSVSQRAAFFAQLEKEKKPESPTTPTRSSRFGRRERSARCQTQPVTETEVCAAARLADTSDSASHDSDGPSASHSTSDSPSKSMFRNAREAMMRSAEEVMAGLSGTVSPRKKYGSRKTSLNEPDEEQQTSDSAKGILKREGSREAQEPRSILKHHSASTETRDSRRASYSEIDNQNDSCVEHPRGILKPESPLPPAMGSPEHEAKHVLKGVLKKDSSVEDSREIKSILKPQSHSLDPDHSSDSSSDDVTLTPAVTGNTSHKNDLAESVRQIDGVRKEDKVVEVTKADAQTTKVEHVHTKAEQKVIMDAAVKQAESIEDTHDLAEALRQIGPTRGMKEKHLEKEDKHKEDDRSTESFTKAKRNTLSVSSSSSSTSSSETDMKHIKNDAVVRRRNAHTKRYDERRSMVELRNLDSGGGSGTPADGSSDSPPTPGDHQQDSSSSGADSADGGSGSGGGGGGLPIPRGTGTGIMDAKQILAQSPIFRKQLQDPQDAKAQRASCDVADLKSTSSLNASGIQESIKSKKSKKSKKLAALQKSGNEGWKQKVNKENTDVNSNVTRRTKGGGGGRERPVSLFERMSQLENSSTSWKNRVSPSDAAKFTVAHKIASNSTSSVPALIKSQASPDILPSTPPRGSPLVDRKKRSPQQKVFKSKTGGNLPSMLSRASPTAVRKSFRRSTSNPADVDNAETFVEGKSVSVFRADDEDFTAFFTSTPEASPYSQNKEDVTLEAADLDHITSNTSQLLVQRRNIKVGRRQRSARNPLKALAAREDIKSEYTEVKLGSGERELRRMKVEELSKNSNLAVEALAGLASKENFSAVALKKVEDNPVVREMAPYSQLMLIQVKGRRWAQSRLVKPSVASVNQGDDFILISQTDIFHYKGEFANVIERAKAAEIALYIIQTKDMGISTAKSVIEIDEKSPKSRKSKFWKLLGGDESSCGQVCGPAEEDDLVELALVAATKVYDVQEDSLVPVTDAWGLMPKVELLASDKTLVFDFGSELYVWSGKRADQTERRVGLALGRELWEEEYDYTDCDINPITPMLSHSNATLIGYRPEWGICAKITENVETILFKEKFIDWPDEAQQTRIKEVKQELLNQAAPVSELSACDANELLDNLPTEPDLVLEMSHLGRGTEYYDEEERRNLTMSTEELEMWHVSENDKEQMSGESLNHLHSADSYVVRWKYHVTSTGRTLKGAPSKHNVTGRYRVAYFFWQGSCSSISDKGVAALMTVELDKERGPHVRVTQGQESPAFLNLFKSALVVHKGKRDEIPSGHWRLFHVRGEMELEAHLVEIEVDSAHLRSRSSLVLINTQTGIVHLWYGAKALRHTRKIASMASEKLISSGKIVEMGWKKGVGIKLKEQFEGAETRDFWEGFGGSRAKNQHFSLLEDENSYDWTPRMWHMVASHNDFQAIEVVSSFRATEVPNPLPFTQADIYSVTQPALFIVDGGHRVWVWQGWWPDESSPEDVAITTGSATLRFNHARRAALETALSYCQLKAKAQAKDKAKKTNKKVVDENPPVIEPEVVIAGLEPLEFSNHFIHWTPREDIRQLQEKEGLWTKGEHYLVSSFLKQLCRTRYSLEELSARPLPDGVDPLRLEVYLSEEEFFEALGMNREEFYNLQSWKQVDNKKKANLF